MPFSYLEQLDGLGLHPLAGERGERGRDGLPGVEHGRVPPGGGGGIAALLHQPLQQGLELGAALLGVAAAHHRQVVQPLFLLLLQTNLSSVTLKTVDSISVLTCPPKMR